MTVRPVKPAILTDLRPGLMAGRAYIERWRKFGTAPDGSIRHALISKSGTPDKWQAWLEYFKRKGLRVQIGLMIDGRQEMSVPEEWPELFDMTAPPSERRYKED